MWKSDLVNYHPAYSYLVPELPQFNAWPSIDEYNQLSHKIVNKNHQPIQFCQQSILDDAHYEAKVFEQGMVNTRLANWHDFFNYLVWQKFPKTKSLINNYQYIDLKAQNFAKKRTARQNFLAHFDESGIIVLSENFELINLLKNHQWHDLFWSQRQVLLKEMRFVVFGHAIYEKLLTPYVGLTAKGIILQVAPEQSDKAIDVLLQEKLNFALSSGDKLSLQPVPLLGIPGWSDEAEHEGFYADKSYFRGLKRI